MRKWMILFLWMLAVPVMILAVGTKVEAETSGDWEYEIVSDSTYSDETAKITGYHGSGTVLNIPNTLDNYTVSSIASWAFSNCNDIERVIIPDSITGNISATAFGRAVQTIEVASNNPVYCSDGGILYDKGKEILVYCPANYSGENIQILSTVTTIAEYAFYYCNKIKNITISDGVQIIGASYDDTIIDEDGFHLIFDEYRDEESVFNGMDELYSINVDNNNNAYTSQDGILYNNDVTELILCPKAKGGDISIPDTVTEIGESAFFGCSNLRSIKIPDDVTNIECYTFFNCIGLENVELGNGLKSIGCYAFGGCSSLSEIILPEKLETIQGGAFIDCVGLTHVILPQHVKSIGSHREVEGGSFSGCTNLKAIDVDSANTTFSSKDGIVYDKAGTTLYLCPEGKEGTVNVPSGVTQIAGFYECDKLTEIILPTSITEIDEYTFYNCKSLQKINIPESVTSIGRISFCGCTSLLKVTLPKNVNLIGAEAFGYWDEPDMGNAVKRHKIDNFTLYGYAGSAAEAYAKENEISFVVIAGTSENNPIEEPTSTNKGTPSVGSAASAAPVKASKLSLSGLSNKIAAGKKIQLTVTFMPSNVSNQNVIWTSSNPKVATVDQNGVVTFKKKTGGKSVIITATATDGSGAKAVFKLKSMKGTVKKVTIPGAKKRTVKAGKTLKLQAKVTATKGANKKLQWTSSNTKYATVSASGKVKTKKAGKGKTVKITAMATDGSGKKQTVKVKMK